MKKIIILLILAVLWGQAFGISLYADAFSPEVTDFGEYIPESAADKLPKDVFDGLAAQKFSFSYFAKLVYDAFSEAAGKSVISFASLAGLVIISSVFHTLAASVKTGGTEQAFSVISGLCVCVFVFTGLLNLFESTDNYLKSLSSFANAATPFITTVYAAGGNITAASVNTTGLLLCITVIENITAYILYPILQISCALSVAKSAAPKIRLGTLSGFIRGVLMFAIGLTVAAISAVMAFQTTLAAAADSLGARAVKFAASSFIPIVGGAVSEAVRTVAGSVSYIRTSVGGIGIAVIVIITLPCFASLMVTRINLSLAASLADILGCERECRVMKEAGGLVNFLIALVSLMAVLFIYFFTLLIRCACSYG